MDFCLCFTCPGKFCELLPGDLESSSLFLEDLIRPVLKSLPLIAAGDFVKLDFSVSESMYLVQIHLRCRVPLEELPCDIEEIGLEIEDLVSQTLLQCFWEVHYSEF